MWIAASEPVIIIQQTAEERNLSLAIQDLDLHEIRELPSECPNGLDALQDYRGVGEGGGD